MTQNVSGKKSRKSEKLLRYSEILHMYDDCNRSEWAARGTFNLVLELSTTFEITSLSFNPIPYGGGGGGRGGLPQLEFFFILLLILIAHIFKLDYHSLSNCRLTT